MNKNEYLEELSSHLTNLSRKKREEIIYNVMKYFEKGIQEGKMESEIIAELGDPGLIAHDYKEHSSSNDSGPPVDYNHLRKALLIVAVIFINLTLAIGPLIAIFAVYFSLYLVVIAVGLTPLYILIQLMIHQSGNIVIQIFASLFCLSLAILLFIGLVKVGQWLNKLLRHYISFNKKIIRGEK